VGVEPSHNAFHTILHVSIDYLELGLLDSAFGGTSALISHAVDIRLDCEDMACRRNMSRTTLSILKSPEVIAVNQDPLGIAGDLVWKQGPAEVPPPPNVEGA
jgi:hypothetical protein